MFGGFLSNISMCFLMATSMLLICLGSSVGATESRISCFAAAAAAAVFSVGAFSLLASRVDEGCSEGDEGGEKGILSSLDEKEFVVSVFTVVFAIVVVVVRCGDGGDGRGVSLGMEKSLCAILRYRQSAKAPVIQ